MKVIIAGSRYISDYNELLLAIQTFPHPITEVVSGGAVGVDAMGERFARDWDKDIKVFYAQWEDLNVPRIKLKVRANGSSYNALAGFNRNEEMAQYADALLLIWDGKSKGSADMLARATRHGLFVHQRIVGEH